MRAAVKKPVGILHTLQLLHLLKPEGVPVSERESVSSSNLSFRTPPELKARLKARDIKGVDHPGAIAKRDIERWYSLMEESLHEVAVSPAEAVVVIYGVHWWLPALTGSALSDLPVQIRRLVGLPPFYRDAQDSLGERLYAMSLSARAALWDAAERYDVAVRRNHEQTFGRALHEVGLHSYDLPQSELWVVENLTAVESDALPAAYMNAILKGGQ